MERKTLRMPKEDLERVREDVERGKFPNESEAIRYFTRLYYDGFLSEYEQSVEIEELAKGRGSPGAIQESAVATDGSGATATTPTNQPEQLPEPATPAPSSDQDCTDDVKQGGEAELEETNQDGEADEGPFWCGRCGFRSDAESDIGVRRHNGIVHEGDAIILDEEPDEDDLVREREISSGDDVLDHTDPKDLKRAYEDANGNISQAAERFEANYRTVYRYMVDHLIHEPNTQAPREREFWCGTCGDGPMTSSGVKRHNSQVHDGEPVILENDPEADEDDRGADGSKYTIDNPEGYLTTIGVSTGGCSTSQMDVCEALGVHADEGVTCWTQDGAVHVAGPDGPDPPPNAENVREVDTRKRYQRAIIQIPWSPLKEVGAIEGGDVKLFDRGDRVIVRAVDEDGELLGEHFEPAKTSESEGGSTDRSTRTVRQPKEFVDYSNLEEAGDPLRGMDVKVPDGVTAEVVKEAVHSGQCRTLADVCEYVGLELNGNRDGMGAMRLIVRRLDLYNELPDPEGYEKPEVPA